MIKKITKTTLFRNFTRVSVQYAGGIIQIDYGFFQGTNRSIYEADRRAPSKMRQPIGLILIFRVIFTLVLSRPSGHSFQRTISRYTDSSAIIIKLIKMDFRPFYYTGFSI